MLNFFIISFTSFFGMAGDKSILSVAESISVTCFTQFLRNVAFAFCLPKTEMRISPPYLMYKGEKGLPVLCLFHYGQQGSGGGQQGGSGNGGGQ